MIHLFKLNGHRIVFNTDTGAAHPVSALAMKIAEVVSPPLSEECPSSLRYSFAKFDSHDLNEAYGEVYALWKSTGCADAAPHPVTETVHADAPEALSLVRQRASAGRIPLRVYINGASVSLVEEIRKEFPASRVCLISDLCGTEVSPAELEKLNRGECYLHLPEGNTLCDALTAAKEYGVRYAYTSLPDSTEPKELIRAAKLLEAWQEDGVTVRFSPFVFAMDTETRKGDLPAGCNGCWAFPLCQGSCAENGSLSSVRCDLRRLCTECGIVLTHNKKSSE